MRHARAVPVQRSFFLYECFVSVDFLFGRTQNVLTLLGSQASFVILSPALSIGS